MINFINKTIDLGEIEPGSVNTVIFPFEGDKNEIVKVVPSCGCTADFEIKDGEIVGKFTESDGNMRKNNTNLKNEYPSGLWPVHKTVTVYLNDGKDLQVLNENGTVFNPDKKREVLTFLAKVKL